MLAPVNRRHHAKFSFRQTLLTLTLVVGMAALLRLFLAI
jgi:hypothetical protein